MKFPLVLLFWVLVLHLSSCSSKGDAGSTDVSASGIASPVPSNELIEVPVATQTPVKSDDLNDFYKQNRGNSRGYRIPIEEGRKFVRSTETTLPDAKGKEVRVAISDYGFNYDVPWRYSEEYVRPRGPVDLESVFFREYRIGNKVFMYFILAEEVRVPSASNSDGFLRLGYLIKDSDGDGIFETLLSTENITVPDWVLR